MRIQHLPHRKPGKELHQRKEKLFSMKDSKTWRKTLGTLGLATSLALGSPGIAHASTSLTQMAQAQRQRDVVDQGLPGIIESIMDTEQAGNTGPPVALDPRYMSELSQWVSTRRDRFALATFDFAGNDMAFIARAGQGGTDAQRVANALSGSGWHAIDSTTINRSVFVNQGKINAKVPQLTPEMIDSVVVQSGVNAQNSQTASNAAGYVAGKIGEVIFDGAGQNQISGEVRNDILGNVLNNIFHH